MTTPRLPPPLSTRPLRRCTRYLILPPSAGRPRAMFPRSLWYVSIFSSHSIRHGPTGCIHHRGGVQSVSIRESLQLAPATLAYHRTRQGGRLVTERRMVSDLYIFDLETFIWKKVTPFEEDDVPEPRYFHSAEPCKSPFHDPS